MLLTSESFSPQDYFLSQQVVACMNSKHLKSADTYVFVKFNPISHGLFERQSWGGGGHDNHEIGTGIKLDVFYTTVTKKLVTTLLLRNYNVITCVSADVWPKFQMLVTPKPLH